MKNNENTNNSYGLQVKNLREKLKLTQGEFATKLEISKSLLVSIENGQRNVTLPLINKIKNLFNVNVLEDNKTPSNVVPVPFYTAKAAAGSGSALPEYSESEVVYFDRRWLKNVLGVAPENLSVITATGDSMKPSINNGDMLLVDNSNINPVNNQVYVIRIHDNRDLIVKRINLNFNGDISYSSDNPEYTRKIYPKENDCIIGKVVWNGNNIYN